VQTTVPASTRISVSRPSAGDSTLATALSVFYFQHGLAGVDPLTTFLSQETTVASVMIKSMLGIISGTPSWAAT